MYKVFINDKEVRFINETDARPKDCLELRTDLNSPEIIGHIQTNKDPGSRIFIIRSSQPEQRFELFISYFPLIGAAGGIVRRANLTGEILMIHRLGKWDLPKGKIDAGESPEEAAVREVQEECGIEDLRIIKKLADTYHLYEFKGMMVVKRTYWYLMVSDHQTALIPQLNEGITEVKWVAEKDLYFLLPAAYASISDLLSKEVLHC